MGHISRCLSLADELCNRGVDCEFVCRELPGNSIEFLKSKGYKVSVMPWNEYEKKGDLVNEWLNISWQQDFFETQSIIKNKNPDWIIVDHYGIDAKWEMEFQKDYKLLIIDDTPNRFHQCNILLDHNLGRIDDDYQKWLPKNCEYLLGIDYLLIRPEFLDLRAISLRNKELGELNRLHISMGGFDEKNITLQVLDAIDKCEEVPENLRIDVILGAKAPNINSVDSKMRDMNKTTELYVGTKMMASLISVSDLGIGAGGLSAWERCALGLPSAIIVLAENQRNIANALKAGGAAKILSENSIEDDIARLFSEINNDRGILKCMSISASQLVKGVGTKKVASKLLDY